MYHTVKQSLVDSVHNVFFFLSGAVLFLGEIYAYLCTLHQISCQGLVAEVKICLHKSYGP